MSTDDPRAFARQLAAQSLERGDDTGWFETLYSLAEQGEVTVPWADQVPNALLVDWVSSNPVTRTVGVVGCGWGDDAEFLAAAGGTVTAFDVAPSALAAVTRRFPDSPVHYRLGNLIDLDPDLIGSFDLVVEINTIQVLTGPARRAAMTNLGALVAPGGKLLVIARRRQADDPTGSMPWPLDRAEIETIGTGLEVLDVEALLDDEDPPTPRWRALYAKRI